MTLGVWDVDAMMRAMPSRLLSEWMAYARLNPFGERRADLRNAQLMALTANVNRDPKKSRAFKPRDFMLDFERQPASGDAMRAKIHLLHAAFGGTLTTSGD